MVTDLPVTGADSDIADDPVPVPFEPEASGRGVVLYRSVGPNELRMILQNGLAGFPDRLAGQPDFHPILDVEHAIAAARDWTVVDSGSGYVIRFVVSHDIARRYPVQREGQCQHLAVLLPAEDLDTFNAAIIDGVQIVMSFGDIPADIAPHVPPVSQNDQ